MININNNIYKETTIDINKKMARNKWTEHVNEVRRQNPELSLREVLKLAKKTYKKDSNSEPEKKSWWSFG